MARPLSSTEADDAIKTAKNGRVVVEDVEALKQGRKGRRALRSAIREIMAEDEVHAAPEDEGLTMGTGIHRDRAP